MPKIPGGGGGFQLGMATFYTQMRGLLKKKRINIVTTTDQIRLKLIKIKCA
jgi:hypothetical protein